MVKQYDVMIVGGGVIGCSIAYQLSKRGMKVLLIEKNQLAGKASKAAAGMLGVQTELDGRSPLYDLAMASRNMYSTLADELKEISGIDIEYVENGMIKLAITEEEAHDLLKIAPSAEKEEQVEWLSPGKLSIYEPHLSRDVAGGLYIPKDGNVSALKLTQALGLASSRLGAEMKEFTDVYDFIIEKSRITGVKTSIGPFYADETIVAGGAWSQSLLKQLNMTFNTYPVKGECFSVKVSRKVVERTIFTDDCYIVPKIGGRLLIGATEKPHTFDETISVDGLLNLMQLATSILPDLAYAKWEKAWAGIRPQTYQGLPFMGRSREWGGLSIATGHYRNGILLAPITGVMMADIIEGKDTHPIDEYVRS
ncbi:glycine oxidase ThiO [Rossellomorea aquimaris]|nr:glycine oxidase ThiO [Rossellomorea aquimaris]WRP04722.1 glycine oxidase ThiO [Rossellomorea aquimaris]